VFCFNAFIWRNCKRIWPSLQVKIQRQDFLNVKLECWNFMK
jgi:hypothetical protein